ncbi:MAG: alpha/beta hydrolase [Rhizobiales bacterium]|nr:alpha/beta hydrolase [Hyphomicrobiales bacterium]
MADSRYACWSNAVRGSLVAMLLAIASLAAAPAGAEIIRKEDTLRGITMTREECAAKPQTLWLNVYGQDFCVRYYLSTAGGQGPRPVVILNGDHNGPVDLARWTWADPSKAADINTDNLVAMADHFSKMARTTAIYLGRIGVEGTSGNHLSRKTLLELRLMNAALDALRQRHGFEGFHLFGESGGGRLVLGLAEMRRDIGCLVSGSGQIAGRVPAAQPRDPGRAYFDIIDDVQLLEQNRALRMMVISDPNDQQVPTDRQQTPMVRMLRQAGYTVPHLFVEATDPKRHSVVEYGAVAMGGCVLGRHDLEIAQAIGTQVRRNADTNRRLQDEARAKSSPQTASDTTRQPGRS